VGSTEGGMADMIENSVSGLLANPFRPQSIEDALRNLIENDELRLRLSHNARNTSLSADKISELALKQLDFYRSVCSVN
jgi:glycosyltransferase involved in cell wall biosynthesis